MRGYLVDPFGKTIEQVETTGYPDFKQQIDVDIICAVTVKHYDNGDRDTVWIDDEGLFEAEQAFFKVEGYPQPLAGRGMLLGTNDTGDTTGAFMELDEFKAMVTFPDIELDRLESIPEGTTTKHPMFGDKEVPIVGSTPVFRQKSKSGK